MNTQPTSPPSSIASALSSKNALSPSLIWILFPFTLLTVGWLNSANGNGSFFDWSLVGIYAHLAMIAVATPLYLLFFHNRNVSPLLSVATYALLGVVRGITVAFVARNLGLESGPFPFFRPVGGIFINVSLFSITVWAIDGRANYRNLMRELTATRSALADSESQINEALQSDRRRLLDLISTTIRGPIEAIQSFANHEASSNRAWQLINETIDQRVKPLSRQLAGEIRTWRPVSTEETPQSRLSGLGALKFSNPTHPFLLGMTALFVAPAMFTRYLSLSEGVALTTTCALIIGAVNTVLTKGLRLQSREFTLLSGTTVGIAVAGISYVPAGLLIAMQDAFEPVKDAYVTSGGAAIAIAGLMIAAARANESRRARVEQDLRESNLQLAAAIAHGSGKLWVQQRQIAEILHGQVQSSLIVAAARMMSSSRTEQDVDSLQLLLKPIDDALEALNNPSHYENLDRFFVELQDVWEGLVEIEGNLSDRARQLLEEDPSTGMIVMTIIRESVGNAYRSGGADLIEVSLDMSGSDLLLLIKNNGIPESAGSSEGLGTQLLRAAATSYARGPEQGVQTLRAVIPVAR